MSFNKVFDNMMEEKLLNLHTGFIGKIVSMNGADRCSVQPLDKIKAYGKEAKSQAMITNVPVANHVRRYSLVQQGLSVQDTFTGGGTITPSSHPEADNVGHLKVEPLQSGDLVFCVCAERDITASSNGQSVTPPVGRHQIANAVVVAYLGRWAHE